MLVPSRVFSGPDDLGTTLAGLILDRLRSRGPGAPFLLGCPGGRSLASTYRALGELAGAAASDLSGLVVVMMDEYVVIDPDGRPVSVDPGLPHSCRRFGQREIVEKLNADLPPARQVAPDRLWLPDPADPDAYEDRLARAGGIDLFLLASGAGDGHVAFNPPGSGRDARTRVVELPTSTRTDNLATFPSFGGRLDAVPRYGVTVGVATIRERSAEAIMVVHGADKQRAADRLRAAEAYDPEWPATVISECRAPQLLLDRAAAGAVAAPTPS